jgi:hypothetical protein
MIFTSLPKEAMLANALILFVASTESYSTVDFISLKVPVAGEREDSFFTSLL